MSDKVVKSNLRDYLGETRVSADFFDALDDELERVVDRAVDRAEANNRKTVQPRDL